MLTRVIENFENEILQKKARSMQQPESGLRALESARHDSAIRISDAPESNNTLYSFKTLFGGAGSNPTSVTRYFRKHNQLIPFKPANE